MAAHPNGQQPLNGAGTQLAHHPDVPRIEPPAEIAAPAQVAPDTAWQLLYQELFDFAPDAHVLTDIDGVIRAVNHPARYDVPVR